MNTKKLLFRSTFLIILIFTTVNSVTGFGGAICSKLNISPCPGGPAKLFVKEGSQMTDPPVINQKMLKFSAPSYIVCLSLTISLALKYYTVAYFESGKCEYSFIIKNHRKYTCKLGIYRVYSLNSTKCNRILNLSLIAN